MIAPYGGGPVVDLLASAERAAELRAESRDWPSWELTARQLCDLELLLAGGFTPLTGFMARAAYLGVRDSMRLPDGMLWPIPIVLDTSAEFARRLQPGSRIALRDGEGVMLAVLAVEDIWELDCAAEAEPVYGTTSPEHPGVQYLLHQTQPLGIGGRLEGVQLPVHYDYRELRHTPWQLRAEFARLGWSRIVGFQTRNPMHRAHQELTFRAAKEVQANLLIHPVVGLTKPGDVDHYTRVRCYQAILGTYPLNTAKLSLLPLAMRMAGPREAVWHAIIRRNHGCSHFIVGRDHAGPGSHSAGDSFYRPYDAQELVSRHSGELGITMVPFKQMVYVPELDSYAPENEVPSGARIFRISGTEQRRRLLLGLELPPWFTFPAVERELRRSSPPRHRQGFTVFFTGLSGSGKSTIANVLMVKLLELGGRAVTLLDGDIVRKHLSTELGFSREHRDMNIRRIGFVAAEVSRAGGIAICAPIAPYDAARREVRQMVSAVAGFVLVHVATPLAVCEERDPKGLYAKARAGLVKEFTGVSDPYEPPTDADVELDTSSMTPEEAAQQVLLILEQEGFVGTDSQAVPEES